MKAIVRALANAPICRWPFKNKIKAAIVVVLLYIVLTVLLNDQRIHNNRDWYELPAECSLSEERRHDMIELAFRMHDSLKKLNVSHFLCYGTLWGALRDEQILPWDNNIDMCTTIKEITKVDEHLLYQTFHRSGLMLSYCNRHGMYEISFKTAEGFLTIFAPFWDVMYRRGWENIFFSGLLKRTDNFPAVLLSKPLPMTKFHGHDFPVAHSGIEILKYFYPDNWWKVIPPAGC